MARFPMTRDTDFFLLPTAFEGPYRRQGMREGSDVRSRRLRRAGRRRIFFISLDDKRLIVQGTQK